MPDLLSQLQSIRTQLAHDGADKLDPARRSEAAALAQMIMVDIEDPGNLIDRIIYQPAENALIRVAVDTGLFQVLTESNLPLTAEDLAKKINVEVTLLERILRGLAAMRAVEETGLDGYSPTKISKAFTTAKGASMARHFGDVLHPSWNKTPQLLKTTNYRNPTDPNRTAFNIAFNTEERFFDYQARYPEIVRNFGIFMASQAVGRPNFLDFFPAKEQLIDGYESELNTTGVMFIDIGGANGEEAREFQRRFPAHPGRLILQDLADTLKHAPATEGLETMPHDFFTPQPVCGARAYYFRRIFHDWNDSLSLKILQKTAAAMAPGYSKMIINDIVMPQRGASSFATNQDLLMMSIFSSLERTEQLWRDLLHAAGLKILRIWSTEGAVESVIEAVLE
ncbi:MAG: hypothetical protein LQ348_005272 [Seirophora lacunosa]|nr:MAG: hypothetical protein LQ344_004992 [Seirophora lacunosa]KAI4180027.1 MAG: hypothetical protein LQ348_005272 [Seirophora lacunosa]